MYKYSFKYVFKDVFDKVVAFIERAGSIILFCSIVVWFLLSFSPSLSYGVDIFCKEFVKKDLNFTTLKENIYNIKGIEKSDFLSVLGLIKGMISFGSISMLITLSIRYVTVILLILISPIAILALCSDSTSGFSKMWFKLILIIPITYKDTKSSIYKVIILGSLYLLYKLNSFINNIFSRVSERVRK